MEKKKKKMEKMEKKRNIRMKSKEKKVGYGEGMEEKGENRGR